MKLVDKYDAAIAEGDVVDNQLQREVIAELQRVADDLSATDHWFSWMRRTSVDGLYLYGPVGGGKTYLVDLFYQYVPEKYKSRFHFHHFMQQVDTQLRSLQGQKDPLRRIAAKLAKTTRLLCFDEFLVFDVADAMILSELLQAILSHGVILVATSNTKPDDLYLGGVQRDRFLPAIELIKQHCNVINLAEKFDYRLGRTPSREAYLSPLTQAIAQKLSMEFDTISPKARDVKELNIQHRSIPCVKCGEHAVWFKFDDICNLPRSQLDYLEIAERFDTVFISEIPILKAEHTVRAILLIHFVDVMYDRGIQLIVSAAAPVDKLYVKGAYYNEFQRTLSRLQEMQSEDYVKRHQRRQVTSL